MAHFPDERSGKRIKRQPLCNDFVADCAAPARMINRLSFVGILELYNVQ